jgi:hypothetical protein
MGKYFRFLLIISISLFGIVSPAQAAGLYSFTGHTFTNCGTTGSSGPSLANCQSSYSSAAWASNLSYFTVSSGIQRWTAPYTGQYQILAAGAVGVGGAKVAGRGAKIQATVTLTQGVSYKILVGQAGTNGTGGSGGGGGATFLTDASNGAIVVAGGGAGALGGTLGNSARADAQTTTSGSISSDNTGAAGTNGGGGGGSTSGWGSGGGGINGNGTGSSGCSTSYGYSFANGGAGGSACSGGLGGFGGGGGTHGNTGGGGGGGGYSGGGGSDQGTNANGGGGGSYVIAGAVSIGTSNGSYNGSSTSITNLNSYNGVTGSATLSAGFLTITPVLDPVTATISSVGGTNVATYRTVFQVVATLSTAGGKVTFYANNKVIPSCKKLYTATTSVTCNWSPSTRMQTVISAVVAPDNGATFNQTPGTVFLVSNRTTRR